MALELSPAVPMYSASFSTLAKPAFPPSPPLPPIAKFTAFALPTEAATDPPALPPAPPMD
ncbi:hypothetical protein D3C80_1070910 [compost metagenome]